jgi:hypothetical protein
VTTTSLVVSIRINAGSATPNGGQEMWRSPVPVAATCIQSPVLVAEGHGRSNCESLFGMSAIPSNNYIRLMLDGAASAAFDGLFIKAIEAVGPLTLFQWLGGRVLVALGGTERFCSRKIKC